MKKKLLLVAVLPFILTSCNDVGRDPLSNSFEQLVPNSNDEDKSSEIQSLVNEAKDEMNNLVSEAFEITSNKTLKDSIQNFYDQEMAYLNNISDLDEAGNALDHIEEDQGSYVEVVFKPLVCATLDKEILPAILQIQDQHKRTSAVDIYYSELEKAHFEDVGDIIGCLYSYENIINFMSEYIGIAFREDEDEEFRKEVEAIISNLLHRVELIIAKLSYEDIDRDVWEFYYTEIEAFDDVTSVEEATELAETIGDNVEAYAYEVSRGAAIGDFNRFKEELLSYFTRKEALEYIASVTAGYYSHLEDSIYKDGCHYNEYFIIVDNFKDEAYAEIRRNVKKYWKEDLSNLCGAYSIYSMDCYYEIRQEYFANSEKIDKLDDLSKMQNDLDVIIEDFTKAAEAIYTKYYG